MGIHELQHGSSSDMLGNEAEQRRRRDVTALDHTEGHG